MDDRQLVRQMRQGDEAAFSEFFDRYYPRLYRFALKRVGQEQHAEEIAQASIVTGIRKIGTWRGEASLFTWLCTICRHEISAFCRVHNRSEVDVFEDNPETRSTLEALSAEIDGPLRLLERQDVARLVQATLDYLPARYGDILEWKYINDLSMQQIAERLGVTPKAVEGLLSRARRAFREGYASLTGAAL